MHIDARSIRCSVAQRTEGEPLNYKQSMVSIVNTGQSCRAEYLSAIEGHNGLNQYDQLRHPDFVVLVQSEID